MTSKREEFGAFWNSQLYELMMYEGSRPKPIIFPPHVLPLLSQSLEQNCNHL